MLSQKIGKSVRPKDAVSKTYINTEKMTVDDISKIEKSPPIVNTSRKNYKIANKAVFDKFGAKAFGFKDTNLSQSIDTGKIKKKDTDSRYNSQTSRVHYESSKRKKNVSELLTPKKSST